jgi:hypothetical protein
MEINTYYILIKNKTLLCFLLIFLITSVQALADSIPMLNNATGEPAYGVGYSVQQTSGGGYIIVGSKYSNEPKFLSKMVWLIKTDANGDLVWDRIFGGSRNDIGYSVQQTTDGGYILVGSTESFGAGGSDLWLIKTDASGNEAWNKTFGGARYDWGHSVQQTNDGGYIMTGTMYSYNSSHLSQMVWLMKTDANGDLVWSRIFGGPRNDWGNSVQQTSDGGYIVVGATRSYGQGGNSAVWLIKTDANGDEAWERAFNGPDDTVGYSVQQTSDGGYIVAGSRVPYGGLIGEIWLIKTNANGNRVWDKTFGGSGEDVGKSVQQTNDGGYIMAGNLGSQSGGIQYIRLIKTDANGNKVWDKSFGESGWNEGKSVQQTNDGGYIVTGSTASYSARNSALWLIKTDPDGNEVWDKILR